MSTRPSPSPPFLSLSYFLSLPLLTFFIFPIFPLSLTSVPFSSGENSVCVAIDAAPVSGLTVVWCGGGETPSLPLPTKRNEGVKRGGRKTEKEEEEEEASSPPTLPLPTSLLVRSSPLFFVRRSSLLLLLLFLLLLLPRPSPIY